MKNCKWTPATSGVKGQHFDASGKPLLRSDLSGIPDAEPLLKFVDDIGSNERRRQASRQVAEWISDGTYARFISGEVQPPSGWLLHIRDSDLDKLPLPEVCKETLGITSGVPRAAAPTALYEALMLVRSGAMYSPALAGPEKSFQFFAASWEIAASFSGDHRTRLALAMNAPLIIRSVPEGSALSPALISLLQRGYITDPTNGALLPAERALTQVAALYGTGDEATLLGIERFTRALQENPERAIRTAATASALSRLRADRSTLHPRERSRWSEGTPPIAASLDDGAAHLDDLLATAEKPADLIALTLVQDLAAPALSRSDVESIRAGVSLGSLTRLSSQDEVREWLDGPRDARPATVPHLEAIAFPRADAPLFSSGIYGWGSPASQIGRLQCATVAHNRSEHLDYRLSFAAEMLYSEPFEGWDSLSISEEPGVREMVIAALATLQRTSGLRATAPQLDALDEGLSYYRQTADSVTRSALAKAGTSRRRTGTAALSAELQTMLAVADACEPLESDDRVVSDRVALAAAAIASYLDDSTPQVTPGGRAAAVDAVLRELNGEPVQPADPLERLSSHKHTGHDLTEEAGVDHRILAETRALAAADLKIAAVPYSEWSSGSPSAVTVILPEFAGIDSSLRDEQDAVVRRLVERFDVEPQAGRIRIPVPPRDMDRLDDLKQFYKEVCSVVSG